VRRVLLSISPSLAIRDVDMDRCGLERSDLSTKDDIVATDRNWATQARADGGKSRRTGQLDRQENEERGSR
jgi:hypothetical protein